MLNAKKKSHDVQNVEHSQLNINALSANTSDPKMATAGIQFKILPENLEVNLNELKDKIKLAKLTELDPFVLQKNHKHYPPLIKECMVHLECEVIDIHRPKNSDHYLITGKVVGASYDKSLGNEIDNVRLSIVKKAFHHFGASSKNTSIRFIGKVTPSSVKTIPFRLEEKLSGKVEEK